MLLVPGGPVCDWIFEKVAHLELQVLWLVLFGSGQFLKPRNQISTETTGTISWSELWSLARLSVYTYEASHVTGVLPSL